MKSFAVVLSCLLVACLSALGCAPEPLNQPCSNDGQCQGRNGDFAYCLESRCVECVGSASCGENRACVDGRCSAG